MSRAVLLLLVAFGLVCAGLVVVELRQTRLAAEKAYERVSMTPIGETEVKLKMEQTWNFTFECGPYTVTFTCTGTWTECRKLAQEAQEDCR